MTIAVKTKVKPRALVLGFSRASDPLHVLIATRRAAHDAIGPAHLFDVLKALFLSRELYEDFADAYRLGMNSLWHGLDVRQNAICVK